MYVLISHPNIPETGAVLEILLYGCLSLSCTCAEKCSQYISISKERHPPATESTWRGRGGEGAGKRRCSDRRGTGMPSGVPEPGPSWTKARICTPLMVDTSLVLKEPGHRVLQALCVQNSVLPSQDHLCIGLPAPRQRLPQGPQ